MSRTPAVHLQRVGRKGSESDRKKTDGAMQAVLHFLFTFLDMSRSNISGNLLSLVEDIQYIARHIERNIVKKLWYQRCH
jgi:oligoribonuclease (3'-5' exoribonuclease)